MASTPELQPASLQLPAAGGKSTHQLINPTDVRLAFKVKTTNNDNYRVHPVYGFAEPNAEASIDVQHTVSFISIFLAEWEINAKIL